MSDVAQMRLVLAGFLEELARVRFGPWNELFLVPPSRDFT